VSAPADLGYRVDVQIDRRAVHVPRASTLGYGKYRAQPGDWIVWSFPISDSDDTARGPDSIGRVLGRVAYAPAIGTDGRAIRNWIAVLRLSSEGTHASVYWVNPEWVSRVHAHRADIGAFWQWFASDAAIANGYAWTIAAGHYGALSANQADPDSLPNGTDWSFAAKLARFAEYWDRAGSVIRDLFGDRIVRGA